MPGATLKVHEILPGRLYQRGMTTGEAAFPTIEAYGIETVVCMIKKHDPILNRYMDESGGSYIYCPIPDGKKIERVRMLALGDLVARRALFAPVLVHCHAGRNRSALVNALALRRLTGCSGAEAVEVVRRRRPNALANEAFVEWLNTLPEEPAWTGGT